ncbi:membrane-binding protein [Leptospira adleri]|uniref:Membrane-binding protein n=1 Tax=Leptospira adleri TaxID=2023186 RepID=A0A2M9YSD6_9LEPT|nr:membrane-binding protein [Leptospira adleri]PJZ54465.1 membrane-binding protein [Leptospira adleri]PJZ61317.1 membrane-binding protein [Leptospira adleri]
MFKIIVFILFCFSFSSILPQSLALKSCLSGNCRNGKGVFLDSFGNECKGTFVNGKLEGYAEVKFKNRETFSGVYKNSSIRSLGQWTDPETGKILYGTWIEDGDCDKKGCKTWAKFIPDSDVECIFRGLFKENRKVGKGSYTCINGESFDGTYANDLANGRGKLRYSAGIIFEGEFKDGHPVFK